MTETELTQTETEQSAVTVAKYDEVLGYIYPTQDNVLNYLFAIKAQ